LDGTRAKKESQGSLARARGAAVSTALRLRSRGESWTELARRLRITPRTLFAWRRGDVAKRRVGRPLGVLGRRAQAFVDDLLERVGPDIGLPTLRAMIPGAGRGPLERHLRDYRLRHRRRRRAHLHQLTWHRPGSVWAVDLADPPEIVDGSGRAIFAVRDLASRYTVAWTPLPRGSAKDVAAATARLFRRVGPPLVLKSDNGSCFVAPEFRMLLARFAIVHLRSPRAWPQYNGACEAGIGVLKALADTAAATRGDPDHWTTDDLEEARSRANDLSRRIGDRLVPAREEWSSRRRLRKPERAELRRAIERQSEELKKVDPKLRRHPARLRRKAIQGALVELGLLSVTSRWVRARSTGRGIGPSYR
jgi:hypothetical protein